jgi:D-alanyl-D-alanine carboxypeptidase/D-alanyl-D-alanine-endopeptidase (penicillin-binding protein 4)
VSEGDTGRPPSDPAPASEAARDDAPEESPEPSRRRNGRWLRRTTAALVLLVLVAAVATYRFDLGSRWFGNDYPSPVTEPALVLPPAGLTLPIPPRVEPVAATMPDEAVDGAAVRRAVAPLLRSKKLGRHVVVEVAGLGNGKVVYRHGTGRVTPASTMKMLTAVAALSALGPAHRFTTSVVATRHAKRVVLVGGGDPLLGRAPAPAGTYPARADLATLARATAQALRRAGRHAVRLGYDASLFRGPTVNPRWEPSYVPDNVVSPISALWVDEGRERTGLAQRSAAPAADAAAVFADALERNHITVLGTPTSAVAPQASAGGRTVADVRSAPLAEIVQHVLEVSDNEGAEVLDRQVALAHGEPASFVGAARAVRAVLGGLGVSTRGARIYDGSGLSRQDRLEPATMLAVIRTAASSRHPGLRSAVANLPVAGFTGSLARRFQTGDPAGLGTVRAKTGTLTGVHGLTGIATSQDGAVMSFVAVADRVKPVNTLDARAQVDRVAAALGGCTCGGR